MALFLPSDVWLEILKVLPFVVYDILVAILYSLVPGRFRHRKNVSGQTVLITGAGSGLGRQLAIEFSKLSTCLVLLDLNKSGLLDTEKLLDRSSRTLLYECDVSNREKVYEVANRIKEEAGKVDILVNNAGIVSGKRFLDIPDEEIERTIEVNTLAHFWMCKAFLPDMIATNKGHIVSVASIAGVCPFPNLTDYCASKHGAVALMESLKLELDAQKIDGVRLSMICPSLISTGLFAGTKAPLTGWLTPEYVADEIISAVLEEKERVFLPRWLIILILLQWAVPSIAKKRFYENSGILDAMDTFKGRTTDNNSNLTEKGPNKERFDNTGG